MDNQHRKIATYRELNQDEIDLINEMKELERQVQEKHQKALTYLIDPNKRIDEDVIRSISLSRTKFQEGFMWLIRAIARPDDPW